MANNQSNSAHPEQIERRSRLRQLAWLPVPLLALTIAGLWIADLRTVYESRVMMGAAESGFHVAGLALHLPVNRARFSRQRSAGLVDVRLRIIAMGCHLIGRRRRG